jgi:hypothetical protein
MREHLRPFHPTVRLDEQRGPALRSLGLISSMVLALLFAGCGGSGSQSQVAQPGLAPAPAPTQINSYFGTAGHLWNSKMDHSNTQVTGEDISQYGVQLAGQVIGSFTSVSGFLDLSLSTVPNELTGQTTGFVLEIPSRAALVRYGNWFQPLIPLAPTNACTSIGGTVTYDYITVPDAAWDFTLDNAYGTFQVTVANSNWNITNISQSLLGGGAPSNPGSGLPSGYCGTGTTGQVVTAASNADNPPIATVTMGFGPTGFFLEDNGSAQATPVGVVRSNALGAGVGAIGILQPASAVNTSDAVAKQYRGFYYEPDVRGGGAVTQIASFGCSGSNCITPPTPTSLAGGVFPNDDPTQSPPQNVIVDLSSQDSTRNGLYPAATVTVSGISFPAVAVVGTMEGRYAIFVLAQDTISNTPLAIYMFQQ